MPASMPSISCPDLPDIGQVIMVQRLAGSRVVHHWGEVREVLLDEGRVTIEQPPGVDRDLWFPEAGAVWWELVGA